MDARRFHLGMAGPTAWRGPRLRLVLSLLPLVALLVSDAQAQRPFRMSDPFYRNETARRDFYDRIALTGEVSYRSAGALQDEGLATSNSDLALRFRFDYELTSRLDLGAVFDAVGGNGGRRVSLSWVVLKYYRFLEQANYAFRLAVDPASDGRVGFPQVDLAFLYTSLLSPLLSTDFAMGVRRVNVGYAQFLPPETPDDAPFVERPRSNVLFTRALGSELHLMMNYNLLFDPAGSNIFVGLLGEGGQYEVVESLVNRSSSTPIDDLSGGDAADDPEQTTPFRGGVLWVRSGLEIKRPNYRLTPFVSVPLQQWSPEASDGGEWPEARIHFGVQLMLR